MIGKRRTKGDPPLPERGAGDLCATVSSLRRDRTGGAGALASAAVDAGASVDLHVIAAHRDRAHGAGALTGAAGNASVTDLTCHVTYTSKVMF